MKLLRLVTLLCFLAPVAFLLGFIAGAPAPGPRPGLQAIDTRYLPVSEYDLARQETSLVVDGIDWLRPNVSFASRVQTSTKPQTEKR
jgi:hypothetical protein